MIRCLMAGFALLPLSAMAESITIGELPSSVCNTENDDYNSHVYFNSRCVLYFPQESAEGENLEHETQAFVYVNNVVVHLFKEKDKDGYFFASKDGAIKVVMSVAEVSTTCVEGEDKCCGSDYAGILEVKTSKNSASISVSYYRGG